MLKLRLLTAIILIPLVILAIFKLPQHYFFAMLLVILALAGWEWTHFLHGKRHWAWNVVEIAVLVALGFLAVFPPAWIIAIIGELWWISVLFWLIYINKNAMISPLPNYLLRILAVITLIPFVAVVFVLQAQPVLLLLLLIIVWLADSSAYFGGRLFGKHKLAATISPNKTIEGAVSAFIVAACFLPLVMWLFHASGNNLTPWIVLLFSTTIAAIIGDLFESFLKRQAGVKDSGNIFPGHGGILDRLDALIAAAPVFLCGLIYLKH